MLPRRLNYLTTATAREELTSPESLRAIATRWYSVGVLTVSTSQQCPSPTRSGTLTGRAQPGRCGRVSTILSSPRHTGRQAWNRQRADTDLTDTVDVSLGSRSRSRSRLSCRAAAVRDDHGNSAHVAADTGGSGDLTRPL
jgi:hypothetical protein